VGIFKTIKKLFSSPSVKESNIVPTKHIEENIEQLEQLKYYDFINGEKLQPAATIQLQVISKSAWGTFFSVSKENPKLIGFEMRSRKKFRHLYHR
jgi:hypothetical protein